MAEDRGALLEEANRRGILPDNLKAEYGEAVRRGLIGSTSPAGGPGAQEGGTRADTLTQAPEEPGGLGSALWQSFLHGATMTGLGAAQSAARVLTPPLAGSMGEPRQQMLGAIDRTIGQREAAYEADPTRQANPIASGIGRIGGEVAATLPLMAMPAARGTLPARLGAGTLGGIAGAQTAPVVPQGDETISPADYARQKAIQSGIAGTAGAALGGALGRRAPMPTTLPSGLPVPQGMEPATQSHIGQLAERRAALLPFSGPMVRAGRERNEEAFNRALANQEVLGPLQRYGIPPVSGNVPVGNAMVDAVRKRIDAGYDVVKQRVTLTETPQLAAELNNLKQLYRNLPADTVRRLDGILEDTINNKLGPPLPGGNLRSMDGTSWKLVDSELGREIRAAFRHDDTELGGALREAQRITRDHLAQQNPQEAPLLRDLDGAWSRYLPMVRAAEHDVKSRGVITPDELSNAIRYFDESADRYARGKAPMQAFAQAGQEAMGRPLPQTEVGRGMFITEPIRLGSGAAMAAGLGAKRAAESSPLLGSLAGLASRATVPAGRLVPGERRNDRLYEVEPPP